MDCELGVIGGGNMGEAIVGAAVGSGFVAAAAVVVSDPVAERRDALSTAHGVACVADNATPAACPRVLLAVKPQVMGEALGAAAEHVHDDALVVSIAAGITTTWLDATLGGRGRIVRVMPNTPLLVGAGASAICPGPRATEDDLAWTRDLLTCGGGIAVEVPEDDMDAVTALSGSGPAYVYYLIEAMIAAGTDEGLDRDTVTRLITQTCAGAAKLLSETGEDPAILRLRVTSPNGVTQRAIETLNAAGIHDALIRAIRAGAARSRELGRG